ncbi:MAG: hypothetical protein JXB19_03460 [Bacteroidales bacterium]|nr:hypothetical protein [Bacteroidales bacterium]
MKRIKIWQPLILIVFALVMVTSCKKDEEDPSLEFEITIPSGWNYNNFYYEEVLRYYAWSPLRLEDDINLVADTIQEDMVIYRQSIAGIDLDQFFTALTADLSTGVNFQLLYSSDTAVNGENAKKIIHLQTIKIAKSGSATDSIEVDIKPMKLVFYKDGYGYVIDCGMLIYTYDYYKPIFEEEIIPTFNFKN